MAAEIYGGQDFERTRRAFGRANKVEKTTVDLNVEHIMLADDSLLAANALRVTVYDVGSGAFNITFVFLDGTYITFAHTELSSKQVFDFEFLFLYIDNSVPQIGKTVTFLFEYRPIEGILGY